MADLPDALEKRVGPFPVVGWLAIVAAGVGAAVLIRRSDLFGGSGEVAPLDDVTEGYGDPAATGALYPGGGLVPIAPQNPGTIPGPATFTTNNEWRIAAVKWATSQGESSVLAEQAVSGYLAGDLLSYQAGLLLGRIISAIGPAPEGASPPDIQPAPTPVPVTPPTIARTPPKTAPRPAPAPAPSPGGNPWVYNYTVKPGDTLSGIARKLNSPGGWQRLYQLNGPGGPNPVLGPNPDLIYAGAVLIIPKG